MSNLQDRAAQWLLTVEETWKGTTGPLTYDPDARYIKGPDGLDVTGEHRDDDEQAGRDYRAFAAAPTHLSEGQALVRELLAEVESLTNPSHCPECGCQGSVRGFCQTCDLKTDRDCLLDKVARLEDRIVELVHEREDSPPPADAALLALANRELLAQLAAKDETERVLEKALEMAMNESGYSPDLISSFIHQAEKALGVKPLLIDAAQTASEGE